MGSTRISFDDCEIDLVAFEVRRGGTVQPVEPQVFELLAHLARHPGRLITKDELIETVWGGRAVSDAALSSRIKSARRALGDDGAAQRYIRTVHGRGVRFVAELASETAPSAPSDPARAAPVLAQGWAQAMLDRPAVLVLPFENATGDQRQDYLADGVTDDLIAALSAWRAFPVISRSTAFVYRGTGETVAQIARATGARYVVGGRLQQDGGRVRATVELVDGTVDEQLWRERFTIDGGALFALQEEIAATVVQAVEPELRQAELRRIQRKMPEDMTAWDMAWRALWHAHRRTIADYDEAERLAAEAAARDPSWGYPQALVAFARFQRAMSGWSRSNARTAFRETYEAAKLALQADDRSWMAYALVGVGELWNNLDYDRALDCLRRAIELNPSASYTYHFSGCVSGFAGMLDEATAHQSKIGRIAPAYPYTCVIESDLALWSMLGGRMDAARRHLARAREADPSYPRAVQREIVFHGLNGDRAAAAEAIGRLAKLGSFDKAYFDASYPFRVEGHRVMFLDGLRRAGLNLS